MVAYIPYADSGNTVPKKNRRETRRLLFCDTRPADLLRVGVGAA
jgi:hypothetical protein